MSRSFTARQYISCPTGGSSNGRSYGLPEENSDTYGELRGKLQKVLTRVLLIPRIYLTFENIVDLDQLASNEAI